MFLPPLAGRNVSAAILLKRLQLFIRIFIQDQYLWFWGGCLIIVNMFRKKWSSPISQWEVWTEHTLWAGLVSAVLKLRVCVWAGQHAADLQTQWRTLWGVYHRLLPAGWVSHARRHGNRGNRGNAGWQCPCLLSVQVQDEKETCGGREGKTSTSLRTNNHFVSQTWTDVTSTRSIGIGKS